MTEIVSSTQSGVQDKSTPLFEQKDNTKDLLKSDNASKDIDIMEEELEEEFEGEVDELEEELEEDVEDPDQDQDVDETVESSNQENIQGGDKGKNKKKKFRFYDSYIPKILKCSFEHNGITSDARQQLNSILIIFSRKFAEMIFHLTGVSKKRTLSSKEVLAATQVFLSGALRTHAIDEGRSAIEKYTKNTKKGVSRQEKAGIIFPPSIAEKFLRRFHASVLMVTHTAPVFFAAVIEYICMEILETASILVNENKRIRITVSDIESAVKSDGELSKLFWKYNVKFLGGSAQQWIHPTLFNRVKNDPRSNKIRDKTGEKKFRAGVVALKDIKRLQKMGNTLIFARQPFEKFVRQILSEHKPNMKIAKNVFPIIQYVIEDYLVNLLIDANAATIHAGRVKLMVQDIDFIRSQRDGIRSVTQNKLPIVLTKPTVSFSDVNQLNMFDSSEPVSTDLSVTGTTLEQPESSESVEQPVEQEQSEPVEQSSA
jgi:histone H3/H4